MLQKIKEILNNENGFFTPIWTLLIPIIVLVIMLVMCLI